MLNIFGASGNGMSIADAYFASLGKHVMSRIQFLDDTREGYVKIEDASSQEGTFINGISSEKTYHKIPEIIERAKVGLERYETVVHPSAVVSNRAKIGKGVFIGANSVICAGAEVGNHCIILQNSTVNHHAVIEDYSTLSSNVCILGYVRIGQNAFIGGAAAIKPYVTIGAGALVGIGSVVTRNVPEGVVVKGVPAR